MRIRLLRASVLSLRTRRGGGHGRSDGIDNACAVFCGGVQDVDDGASVAVRAYPRGKLPALVKLNWWRDEKGAVSYVNLRFLLAPTLAEG